MTPTTARTINTRVSANEDTEMTTPIYDKVYFDGLAALDAAERGDASASPDDLRKAEEMLTFLGATKNDKGEWCVFPEKRRKVLTEPQVAEIARRVYCNDEVMSEIADQLDISPSYLSRLLKAAKAAGDFTVTVTPGPAPVRALLAAAERALEQLREVNPHPVRTIEALESAIALAKGGK